MKRRQFLQTGVLASAAVGFPAILHAQPNHPHILLLLVDDLNGWAGCLGGHPQARTPNIDALAASGVLFSNAHCAAPACNPSRTNLLTSVLPSTSGVYDNPDDWRDLIPDVTTLPRHCINNGYSTIGAGKIEHYVETDGVWTHRSSDHKKVFPPLMCQNALPSGTNNQLDWGPSDLERNQHSEAIFADYLGDYLLNPVPGPNFFAYGTTRPHLPWYVPREYLEHFPPDEIMLPEIRLDDLEDIPDAGRDFALSHFHDRTTLGKQWHIAVASYLAAAEFADAMIGRVLDAWDSSPIRDETIIMLTSDHGLHLGEKLHWKKFALWEETTHVPLIAHVPWMNNGGSACLEAVQLGDVMPTLCELCELPLLDDQFEGESFLAQLEDPTLSRERPALTTWLPGNHSVRTERWRYIRYADASEELYDHENDPHEWTNLAGDGQYRDLMDQLAVWMPDDA